MNKEKQKRLEKAGWKIGTAEEFLNFPNDILKVRVINVPGSKWNYFRAREYVQSKLKNGRLVWKAGKFRSLRYRSLNSCWKEAGMFGKPVCGSLHMKNVLFEDL